MLISFIDAFRVSYLKMSRDFFDIDVLLCFRSIVLSLTDCFIKSRNQKMTAIKRYEIRSMQEGTYNQCTIQ